MTKARHASSVPRVTGSIYKPAGKPGARVAQTFPLLPHYGKFTALQAYNFLPYTAREPFYNELNIAVPRCCVDCIRFIIGLLRLSMNQEPQKQDNRPPITALRAVMIGQLVVNLPVIAIVLLAFFLGGILFPEQPWISLAAAIVLGWLYWSFAIRRWRAWAISRGVPAAELTRMASFSGLARPGDWYHPDEDEDDNNAHRS